MSYKTYVNDTQIFGNNECYPEWIAYIKSKGIEVGENDSYTDELDNFMEALDVIESIVMKLEAKRRENKKNGLSFHSKSIFNLGEIYDAVATDPDEESLLDSEIEYIQNAYMFMPYAFLKACEDIVEYTGLSFEGRHTRIYKLKDGCKIKVTAG